MMTWHRRRQRVLGLLTRPSATRTTFQNFETNGPNNSIHLMCAPDFTRVSKTFRTQRFPAQFTRRQVIWIEMSYVHALFFEAFAQHKLVMRSSHRWDHSTPYPLVSPASSWARVSLRRLVASSARIGVATEWDYWCASYP